MNALEEYLLSKESKLTFIAHLVGVSYPTFRKMLDEPTLFRVSQIEALEEHFNESLRDFFFSHK